MANGRFKSSDLAEISLVNLRESAQQLTDEYEKRAGNEYKHK